MGIPNWMWKKVFDIKLLNRIIQLFHKTIISLLVFSVMFSVYHFPIIFDTCEIESCSSLYFYNDIVSWQHYFFGGHL